MSGTHARLSASSAHRWLRCAGSVAASKGLNSASIHAATGTLAHSIAAHCLADQQTSPTDYLLRRETVDGFEVECDLEMVDAIRLYLDTVDADLEKGDLGWIEMPLLDALQKIDPDLGGTADYVRYRPATRKLRVFDFKYGSGTYVEADDNEQLKLYALGAMLQVGQPVAEVEITIVQPRFEGAEPVRGYTFKAVDILDFVADVKEAAKRSREKDASLVAGDHCKDTFCPAARTCPELLKRRNALMKQDFPAIKGYDAVALSKALADVPLVKLHIKALEEFAYAEAVKGEHIPGFKLVDKRPVRRWKSEGDVIEWAQSQALDPYAPREVLSPAQMEKKLAETAPRGKKKDAGRALDPFTEKVSSGTVLVSEADERAPAKLIAPTDFPALT